MQIILFDDKVRFSLLPFTYTRPIADIRCGILTMRERWEYLFQQKTSTLTASYLQTIFPLATCEDNLIINASIFGTEKLLQSINELKINEQLVQDDVIIAARINHSNFDFNTLKTILHELKTKYFEGVVLKLKNVWDIFSLNEAAIKNDFPIITKNRKSELIPNHCFAIGNENIFIEKGAIINAGCVLNASTGPIYIAKDAEILEGALLRGPIALGEHAVIKMGAKIYGGTTIGPTCKVGGEISNVVFFANSNKGHDGYLGNSVIGEWCNLGADTNCSNLKNNYDFIKIWDEHTNKSIQTGLQFCGLLMGDHSKCGINTMFNTGTVVGVSANIFGGSFPEKFIPSFSWGGSEGLVTYSFERAMDTAKRMMERRKIILTEQAIQMYHHLFELTNTQRSIFTKS